MKKKIDLSELVADEFGATSSTPAAIGSIPVSANQEDFVSMGTTSALKAREIIDNAYAIIAIELLCGAQALEFRKEKPGKGTQAAYNLVRKYVKPLTEDRPLCYDIDRLTEAVKNRAFVKVVEQAVGKLK